MLKSAQFLCSLTLISLALSFSGHVAARAEDVVHAVGRIFAADGKTPIAGAMVAVYDDKNRVLQYVRTESDGSYALPLRKGDLHLTKHSGGGVFKATPYWPTHTDQFGVYPVRGPW